MMDTVDASAVESEVDGMDLSVDPTGKTVEQVKQQLVRFLSNAELSEFHLDVANSFGIAEVRRLGRLRNDPWPDTTKFYDNNIVVWVEKGAGVEKYRLDGWRVHVELRTWTPGAQGDGHWRIEPLLIGSTPVRDDAWSMAALISWLLGVD